MKYFIFFFFCFPSIVLAQDSAKKGPNESEGLKSFIIDPLLSFFRDDYTAIYIAVIMVVLAITLIIEYRQRISVPVIKDLKNINSLFSKTYNSESFSENIENIKEKLQSAEFYNIKPVWFEFNETLTTQKDSNGRQVWFNTKRPEEYFTPTSVTRNRGNFNSIESWGSFFVGAGLLFTFLGLVAALDQASTAISAAAGNTSGVLGALETMLQISAFKFLTSVAGIFCSIIITAYARSSQNQVLGYLNRFNDQLERCLTFMPIEQLQLRTIEAIEKMSVSVSEGVSQGVQNIAGNELRDFATALGSISESLARSKTDIKGISKIYSEEMENIKKSLESALGSISTELEQWTIEMNSVLKANLSNTNDVLINFVENLDNAVEKSEKAATNFNTEIIENINDAAASLGKNVNELSKGIDKRVDSADNYMERINDASSKLIADTDKVTNALKVLVDKLSSGDNSFSKSMDQFENKIDDLSNNFSNTVKSIEKVSQSFERELSKLQNKDNNVRQQLQTAVSQFSSSVSDSVKNFSDLKREINSTFDPLKQSVEELSENIKNSSKGSRLFFWKK